MQPAGQANSLSRSPPICDSHLILLRFLSPFGGQMGPQIKEAKLEQMRLSPHEFHLSTFGAASS